MADEKSIRQSRARSNSSTPNQHYQNLLNHIRQKQEKNTDLPTIREFMSFDPKADAEVLFNSMKGLGTHEKAIIDILTQRTNKQRQEIAASYKEMYGKEIIKAFKGELKIIINGHFEDVILALLKTPEVYDAESIHHAFSSGFTTDDGVLIDIFSTRNNAELDAIRKAYQSGYGKDLMQDIEKLHGSDGFKELLLAILAETREAEEDVNPEQARWDARAMYDAGPRHWITDTAFRSIFTGRSYTHMRLAIAAFEEMADVEIVSFAKHKDTYFAELLHSAFKGLTTNHKRVIRTLVSRSEIDLETTKDKFEDIYHKPLGSVIAQETSGNYRNILLGLAGAHEEIRRLDHSPRRSVDLHHTKLKL
ncbi:annexin A13-like isoform X2 [Paramacrobiotus metropolitanus]|uniref:annexin A13-like isoform X2 n=1 Tax=Paramacrobiotus metropolitanus TaxID=2943436 RepID=UPI002445DF18|nr:annexin A13-like isoform X2 [Paramacrobiotus metropolitanus]